MGPDWGADWGEAVRRLPRVPWRTVGLAVAVPLVVVGGYLALRPDPRPAAIVLPRATDVPALTATTAVPDGAQGAPAILVHAAGAVALPGVYRMSEGARVIDLLNAAGGPAAGGDLSGVNLAAPLFDGARVHFPSGGEDPLPEVGIVEMPAESPGSARPDAGTDAPASPLDINAATAGELERLPGIGPVTAAAIVEHRAQAGPFRSVEDLQDVTGIGPVKLGAIRDLVRVSS